MMHILTWWWIFKKFVFIKEKVCLWSGVCVYIYILCNCLRNLAILIIKVEDNEFLLCVPLINSSKLINKRKFGKRKYAISNMQWNHFCKSTLKNTHKQKQIHWTPKPDYLIIYYPWIFWVNFWIVCITNQ